MGPSTRLSDRTCLLGSLTKPNSSVASTALRQVIGFHPTPQSDVQSTSECVQAARSATSTVLVQDKQGQVPRGPLSPRSALQNLLTASRKGDHNNETTSPSSTREKEKELAPEPRSQQHIVETTVIAEAQVATTIKQASSRGSQIGFAAAVGGLIGSDSDDHNRSFGTGCKPNCISGKSDCLQRAPPSTARRKHAESSLFLLLTPSPTIDSVCSSMDFLNSCYLCRHRLAQGHDVFMYNGDKAFCSTECRYQQIAMDERKEKCPPAVIRSGSVSATAHHAGHRHSLCVMDTAAAA